MILEAKYNGPFARVTVPGFAHKVVKRGETTKMRVSEGVPVGGDWIITKGKKEHEAGLKKVAKERADARKAKLEARQALKEKMKEKTEKAVVDSDTAPDEKGK